MSTTQTLYGNASLEAAGTDSASVVPPFTQVLSDISHLAPVLYRALEHGAHEMRSFFEMDNEHPDPFLAPALVRYHAKKFLKNHGIEAVEFEMQELANIGLSIVSGGYHLRILKSDNGQLPPPGDSERKRRFYSQQTAMVVLSSGEAVTTSLNLVVLWDFDPSYNLRDLWLCCPKAGGNGRASVEDHWTEPIPHPASVVPPEEEDHAQDVDDLGIRPRVSPKVATND